MMKGSDSRLIAGSVVLLAISLSLSTLFMANGAVDFFGPLGDYPSPQIVENRARGAIDPAVELGDLVVVRARKCIKARRPIKVSGRLDWVELDGRRRISGGPASEGVRLPGCEDFVFRNQMPPGITAGFWRIEGSEEAEVGLFTQRRAWFTEEFRVLQEGSR